MIIPRQIDDHIAINPFMYTLTVAYWGSLAQLIGSRTMLTNITEPIYTIAVMAAVLVFWILVVQYSRYQSNIKEKKGTEEEEVARKFDFVSYAVIPVLGAGIVGFLALIVSDTLIAREYIAGAEECVFVSALIAFVLYCFADKYIIRKVGKAVHFDLMMDKVVEVAGSAVKDADDFEEKLKKLKKLEDLGIL